MTSPLYQLEAFGLGSAWLTWKLARGALDDVCTRCHGRGFYVLSPCQNREPGYRDPPCEPENGCGRCRRKCPACAGARTYEVEVHAEDFGDDASRTLARATFPGLMVNEMLRSDREAAALG